MANRTGALMDRNHCADSRELAVRFALWAYGLQAIPSAESIRANFHMSRATAYRWRAAFCAAIGVPSHTERNGRLTPAEIRRANKMAVGLRLAINAAERCRNCAFYRLLYTNQWWGSCQTHNFPVRASHVCNTFREFKTTGGNRHRLERNLP